jgi:VRR-NUC domain
VTEADLQRAVIETAHALGWLVAHFRPAQTARGWRTPVEAEGAGFPDLVLVRRARLIFAELKGERGRLSEPQRGWLTELLQVCLAIDGRLGGPGPVLVQLWTPTEWHSGVIERALR